MVDLYRGAEVEETARPRAPEAEPECKPRWFGLPGRRRLKRCPREEERAVPPAVESANAAFTRDAANELELLFPRVPNPDVLIYVYPHLATAARVPVPGYTTAVPLFDRVEYALPGDFPGVAGASWPVRPPERVRAGESPVGPTKLPEVAAGDREQEELRPGDGPADGQAAEVDAVDEAGADQPGQGAEEETQVGADDRAGDRNAGVAEAAAEAGPQEVETVADAEVVRPAVEEPRAASLAAGNPPPAEPAIPAYEVLVNGVRDPECRDVDVWRGSLRANARRLLIQCGFRLGAWPGDADSVTDWVISDGFKARVDGLPGLLELIGGYGLDWTVSERDRRVDFRRRER